jgi:hypothetical protein
LPIILLTILLLLMHISHVHGTTFRQTSLD